QVPPVLRPGTLGVDLDQPPVGSAGVGQRDQPAAAEPGLGNLLPAAEDLLEGLAGGGQPERALGRAPEDVDRGPTAVLADRDRPRGIGPAGGNQDRLVLGRWPTEVMAADVLAVEVALREDQVEEGGVA